MGAPLAYKYLYQKDTAQAEAQKKPKQSYFHAAYANIPEKSKAHRGGEDAWILEDHLLAVADGVGGWNNKGVDPGIFAREISVHVSQIFQEKRASGRKIFEISLKEILVEAVVRTKAKGTSTFVMASIDEDGDKINTLNLGDSGFLLLRPDLT